MTTEKLLHLMNEQHKFLDKLKKKRDINSVKQTITKTCRELLQN